MDLLTHPNGLLTAPLVIAHRFYSFLYFRAGYFLYRLQWVYAVPIILPLSVVDRSWTRFRNWAIPRLATPRWAHDRKVAAIQRQVREWNKAGRRGRLCTGRSACESMSVRPARYKRVLTRISTEKLRDILQVNLDHRTVRVEPGVTIGQLLDYLLPLGYTLPVVPPLEDFTVGGLINGCGLSSSGRKYGLFQHTCFGYEIVTSQGDWIDVKKDPASENQPLFYGIPWSHGSLGMMVAATLRIIPCQKYVRLTYQTCSSRAELITHLREESTRAGTEFVEAILFRPDAGVVISGQFAEQIPKNAKLNPLGKWHKPLFFKYIEAMLEEVNAGSGNGERSGHYSHQRVEYIPVRDYYLRHQKGLVWKVEEAIPFANKWWFRYLLGWALPPKPSLMKRVATIRPLKDYFNLHNHCQDFMIPATSLNEGVALKAMDEELHVYPLLLTPFNLPSQPGLLRNRSGVNQLYINISVYGMSQLVGDHRLRPSESIPRLENFLREVHGMKMLYADSYQTCAEFWEMFDASLYDWLRAKYDCRAAFPSVYEKVAREARE